MNQVMGWGRVVVVAGMLVLAGVTGAAPAAEPTEADYYPILTFQPPTGEVLEVGDIELLPDGRIALGTRRGEIWLMEQAFTDDPSQAVFKRFAHGLHEVLGLVVRDGWLYVTQRCDVSRLRDTNGDDRADEFEVVSAGWGITGDYHEYAFGSEFDADGAIWVTLCLTGSFSSSTLYRGWCLRVFPDGRTVPTCSGIRSPGGIGFNAVGDVFYTDNQGPWNGTCGLKHLAPGSFQGHPGGFQWYSQTDAIGPRPQEPVSGSRIVVEAARIPELMPTAVLLPYQKMGQSASGIVCDTTGGKFGPFQNQLFVSDQSHSTVMRVFLEKINGRYQGVCFPFRKGFGSGNVGMKMTPDGSMFVGGTNRGWGSRGNKPFAIERMVWTGQVPFEIQEMRAKADGFEFYFTQPVDVKTAADPNSYRCETYTYIYQGNYGSPEVDHTKPTITQIAVADDQRTVRLTVNGLQPGHVHEFHCDGVRSAAGLPLLHKEAYYTLNIIPNADQPVVQAEQAANAMK